MSKKDLQREDVIARLHSHLLQTGLARTSLRQLARAAGTSDRMLLYYFKDKAELMEAVLERVAEDLAGELDTALPAQERLSPGDLFERAASLTSGDTVRPHMRLGLELTAAASRGDTPYTEIATAISTGFVHWIDERLAIADPDDRRAMAAMIFAMIEGLNVLSVCTPLSVQEDAARQFRAILSDKDR